MSIPARSCVRHICSAAFAHSAQFDHRCTVELARICPFTAFGRLRKLSRATVAVSIFVVTLSKEVWKIALSERLE